VNVRQQLSQMTRPFADLKVLALQADEAACGHYRIRYPMQFLHQGGAQVQVTSALSGPMLQAAEIIIAQRQYHPAIFDMLQSARDAGRTLIFEIDDNVHRVVPNSVAYRVYKPGSETCHGVERFIKGSDALFTSSPELASQYGPWNKRTWVLPNCIDFGVRDWDSPVPRDPRLEGKIVIGWAGSITHQDDWAPLKGVLAPVLARYPQAVFAIVSAHQTMDAFQQGLDLPAERIVRLDPTDFQAFPALPAQFDIGLVPVVNDAFNRAKSDLKPLEYGARSVPYVASAIAPYMRLHTETEGQGGFLCRSTQEWIDAISELIEEETTRSSMGDFMYHYVREERSIERNVYRWADAMREARDARWYSPDMERRYSLKEKPGRNEPCPCGAQSDDGRPIKYKKHCAPAYG
jgi:glycosyltransferase involved in cell wall biosynthesis